MLERKEAYSFLQFQLRFHHMHCTQAAVNGSTSNRRARLLNIAILIIILGDLNVQGITDHGKIWNRNINLDS